MKKTSLYIVILIIPVLLVCVAFVHVRKVEYIGQRCPPDMEFIAGNDSIASFFMGKSQETNLNWAIYMDWLKKMYKKFPQVAMDARPLGYDEPAKNNDPILTSQLDNPAFAYYPVTGCSWMQIQDYLGWKTDRMNESIMMQEVFIKIDSNKIENYNFNTECLVAYGYDAGHGKPIVDHSNSESYDRFTQSFYYPFLFTGFRLPTEEEWDYASGQEFRNTTTGKPGSQPYGKKFYLSTFIFNKASSVALMHYIKNAGEKHLPEMNKLRGADACDMSNFGLGNMGDNVREWMMDIYSESPRHYNSTEAIYRDNGFHVGAFLSDYRNMDGYFVDEDSLRRMPYRTMGCRNNGMDLNISRRTWRMKDTLIPNPDSAIAIRGLKKVMRESWRQNGYSRPNSNQGKPLVVIDTFEGLRTKWNIERTYFKWVKVKRNYEDIKNISMQDRVVKNGTWQSPSTTARGKMKQTDAAPDLGFRTVIQYTGIPISKKYKVNWK